MKEKHKWQWCWGCGSHVKCGNCGNNCCNAMYGKICPVCGKSDGHRNKCVDCKIETIDCSDCKTAYIVQETTNPPLYLRIAERLSYTNLGNEICRWKFHGPFRKKVRK